ncbi:hypothetical protein KAU11_11515 [Candidatus Babeliales bacterium]|nr:hypothetical protein [Candidatus Babeliales bacterium]
MLCGGIVAFDNTGKEAGCYEFAITPQTEGAPDTVEWLKRKMVEIDGKTISVYDNAMKNGEAPEIAMENVTKWCIQTLIDNDCDTGNLICFPCAFDGKYWTNYCRRCNKNGYANYLKAFPKSWTDPDEERYRDPFEFRHIDGQTFVMAQLKLKKRPLLRKLKPVFFTAEELEDYSKVIHDALSDARLQGQLFFRAANMDLIELKQ